MASASLTKWKHERSQSLDEIEKALQLAYPRKKGGRKPQKSQSLNYSYLLLLSSEFQGFCRDIHTEASLHIARSINPPISTLLENLLRKHRKIDHGNPSPSNLADDFKSFGFDFWATLELHSKWNTSRRKKLDGINTWRNAIAHQNFDPKTFGDQFTLYLDWVQKMRKSCAELAEEMDKVLKQQLITITGKVPW